jgi:hypothetical protein
VVVCYMEPRVWARLGSFSRRWWRSRSSAQVAARKRSPRPAASARHRSVGIPECDEYLQRWEACIRRSSLPAAGALQAFKAQRESFRIAAATPEGQATFKEKCRSMIDKLATDKACAGGDSPGGAPAAPGK